MLADDYNDFASFTKARHLADIEPQVTSELIRHKILKRISCSDVNAGKLRRMYRVNRLLPVL